MPRDRSDQKNGRAPSARDLALSSGAVFDSQNKRGRGEEPEDPAGLNAEAILYAGSGLAAALDRLGSQLTSLNSHAQRVADAAERIADIMEQEK